MDSIKAIPTYNRRIDSHKPKFKGKGAGYEPTTPVDVIKIVFITLFVYFVCSMMLWIGLEIAMSWGT